MKLNQILFIALLILSSPVLAASTNPGIQQKGAVTPGDCVEWFKAGVVEDAGIVCGGGGGGGSPGGANGTVQYNNSGSFGGFTVGGDGTLDTSTGTLIITKTNGVAFGTAATVNTGTSGATIPLLNANNNWSGVNAFGFNDFALKGSSSGSIFIDSLSAAASGTWTFQNGSDTIVGRATTDTLTNKTISGASNTLSAIDTGSLATVQGNGAKVQLSTGSTTTGDCVEFDANGNTVDAGAACGSGSGGVTSVGLSTNLAFMTVASSPITSSGTITLNGTASQTANRFVATPNGSTGVVGLRAIVAADVPTLNQDTTGNAATVTTNANLTGPVTSTGNATAITANAVTTSTINANAVTYAKLQSETASTLLGNPTGSGAVPSEITLGTGLSFSGSVLNATGSGTVNSGTAGQLTYYAGSGTAVSGNSNATISSGALTLGVAGSVGGSLKLSGSSTGTTTIQPPSSAAATLTTPTGTDTLAGIASTQTLTNKTISGSANTLSNIATGSLATVQGNGTKVQLSTSTTTTNDCVKFDANGNTVDSGAACGTGAVTSVSNSDTTLTISPTTGAVVASLNLATANTWGGAQNFSGGLLGSGANLYGSSPQLILGAGTSSIGAIAFHNSSNNNTLTLQSGAPAGNVTFTLPIADGTVNQAIVTNGSGSLLFSSVGTVVASADLTAQTATQNVISYTTPAANGSFRVGGYVDITAVTTDVVQLQVSWTDENSASRTQIFYPMGATSPGLGVTGFVAFPTADIRAKASTSILVDAVLTTGIGSITYDVGGTLQQLR